MRELQAINDLEAPVFKHLEEAGKIAERELSNDVSLDNVQTKSWHLKKAAEAAEIASWPKQEIASKLFDIIEKHGFNISKRLVYHVLSPLGYSSTDASATIAQPNSSLNTDTVFSKENSREIEIVDNVVGFLKDTVRPYLTSKSFMTKLLLSQEIEQAKIAFERAKKTDDKISINAALKELEELETRAERNRRQYEEDYFTRKQLLYNGEQAWDNRHSITVFQQYDLLKLIEAHNVGAGGQMFISCVKDLTLTPKQAHKYKTGEIRELIAIYDPKNRAEAIKAGFYGQQCEKVICKDCKTNYDPDIQVCNLEIVNKLKNTKHVCGCQEFIPCKSWRVKIDKGGGSRVLHCFACLGKSKPITLSLPQEKGVVVDDKLTKMFNETYPQWKKDNQIG